MWRLGGIESVRGFAHGAQLGESVWSGQIELSPARRSTTPVVFADVGWAGSSHDWPGDDPLWSLGAGVSFFYGIFRAEVVAPKLDDVWLEFYFAGVL
jgi:hemolysin activation/secretion protein